MLDFRSPEEALKFLGDTSEGQSVLNMAIMKFLRQETERLKQLIQEEINDYYRSYTPVEYERTYNFMKSLRIGEPKINNDGTISMEIYFDRDLSYHPSVMGDHYPMGYVPWLIEHGWDISDKLGIKPMFTIHPGAQYIQKAVKRFNESNPHGLKVMVFHGDERYL